MMKKFIYEDITAPNGPAVFEIIRREGFPDKMYRRLIGEEIGDPKLIAEALEQAYEQGRKDRLAEVKKVLEI